MAQRTKIVWNIFYLLLFVGLTAYALLSVYGYKYDFSTRTLVPMGVVEVSAHPKAVTMDLGGETIKKETPLKIWDLSYGQYNLVLSQKGFHNWQHLIPVESDRIVRVADIILRPSDLGLYTTAVGEFRSPLTTAQGVTVLFRRSSRLIYLWQGPQLRLLSFPPELKTVNAIYPLSSEELLIEENERGYGRYNITQKTLTWLTLPHGGEVYLDETVSGVFYYLFQKKLYRVDKTGNYELLAEGVEQLSVGNDFLYYVATEGLYRLAKQSLFVSTPAPELMVAPIKSGSRVVVAPGEERLVYLQDRELYVWRRASNDFIWLSSIKDPLQVVWLDTHNLWVQTSDQIQLCHVEFGDCREFIPQTEARIAPAWDSTNHLLYYADQQGMKRFSLSYY